MEIKLSKNQQNIVNTWVNNAGIKGASSNSYNWIKRKHKAVYEYILDSYKNLNTLKNHVNTLGQVLKKLGKEDLYKIYSKEATELNKASVEQQEDQTISRDRKDNFVCFNDLVKRREEYRELFEENPQNNKLNTNYLILALYTLQPPIRMEYKDMQIVDEEPPRDDRNYLYDNNGKYTVVINKDKVSGKYGQARFTLPNELNKIIRESLKQYPREFVLSTLRDGDYPLGKQGFERLLKEMFQPKSVSIDLLRSAYITHFYRDPKVSLKQKKELASKMRHSVSIAEQAYKKIDVDCESANREKLPPIPESSLAAPKVKAQSPTKKKATFNLKEYMKAYREKNKEKYRKIANDYYKANRNEILKKKVLWNVNVAGNVVQPTKKTIEKYNLTYDRKTHQWI